MASEVAIDRRAPIVIAPPLAGDGWFVSNGCCTPNVHRDLRLAINGDRIGTPETFAIDWTRVKNDRIYDGDGSQNEQHYAFGADVLAVADATVVIVQDGEPEQVPTSDWSRRRAPSWPATWWFSSWSRMSSPRTPTSSRAASR